MEKLTDDRETRHFTCIGNFVNDEGLEALIMRRREQYRDDFMSGEKIVSALRTSDLENQLGKANSIALVREHEAAVPMLELGFERVVIVDGGQFDPIELISSTKQEFKKIGVSGLNLDEQFFENFIESIADVETLWLQSVLAPEAMIAEQIGRMKSLSSLGLSSCGIGEDGAALIAKSQSDLEHLDLSENNLGEHGARFIALHMRKLRSLNVSDNDIGLEGVRAIASSLGELETLVVGENSIGDDGLSLVATNLINIKSLDVWDNDISADGFSKLATKLSRLQKLIIGFNTIGSVGAIAISKFITDLRVLDIGNNSINGSGSRAIAENLKNLSYLDLGFNNIGGEDADYIFEKFYNTSIEYLNLKNNPCVDEVLTKEVFENTDAKSLLAAWADFRSAQEIDAVRPLNEAKLLVLGNEAVGKTSLVRFLKDGTPCDPDERKTRGISQHERIETSSWRPDGGNVRLNVWDFAGQDITHGTHRYFLTERSLYLLVLEDRRQDDPPVQPWMRIIEALAGDSPVFVVINKSDDGKSDLRLDERGLRKQFPQIVGIFRTSCTGDEWSEESIKALRHKISDTLEEDARLEHIRSPVQANWIAVKSEVNKRARQEAVLELDTFNDICMDTSIVGDRTIEDPALRRALLRQLHELGVIVAHGLTRRSPAARKGITLLDPNWLTDAIYKLLNDVKLQEKGGIFTREDLEEWLDPGKYPVERHEFILSMMQERSIELCFRLPGETEAYLAPEALPVNSPSFDGWDEGALRFRYRYSHLPSSVVPRFIVRMHNRLEEPHDAWLNGVRLSIGSANALVRANRDEKYIDIAIKGRSRRDALSAIRNEFDRIHEVFADLDVSAFVPMPHLSTVEESFEHLLHLEEKNGPDYVHWPTGASKGYRVSDVLSGVEHRRTTEQSLDNDIPARENNGTPSSTLSFANIYPLATSIFIFVLLLFETSSPWWVQVAAAFTSYSVVRFVLRMFDRGFLFRRLLIAWSTGGATLLAVGSFSFALDLGWLTASYGQSAPLTVGGTWIIGLIVFAFLAFKEANPSN